MKKIQTFSIIGIHRSGTTLLTAILDAHSKLAVCPETKIFGRIFSIKADKTTTGFATNYSILSGCRLWLANKNDRAKEVIDSMLLEKDLHLTSVQQLLEKLVIRYSRLKEASVVGEKSPNHLHYVNQIRGLCPNHKFICLCRDELDTVYSLYHAMKSANQVKTSMHLLLGSAYFVKKGKPRITSLKSKKSSDILFMQYEDFVSDPEKEISNVCSFLGVEFESDMLEKSRANYFMPDGKPLAHRNLKMPISEAFIGKGERSLSDRERLLLRAYFLEEGVASIFLLFKESRCLLQDLWYLLYHRFRFRADPLYWQHIKAYLRFCRTKVAYAVRPSRLK